MRCTKDKEKVPDNFLKYSGTLVLQFFLFLLPEKGKFILSTDFVIRPFLGLWPLKINTKYTYTM